VRYSATRATETSEGNPAGIQVARLATTASLHHYRAWFSSHTDVEVKSNANSGLRAMTSDAVRFALAFRLVIEIAPLQVYSSALIFSPRRSTVRDHFWHHVPDWIEQTPVVPKDWDSTLQVPNTHSNSINVVRFSPDGTLIASGSSGNTVRLWDPATGTCRSTLEGHSRGVTSVAFSSDGELLASGSGDATVKLWDPATGTCQHSEGTCKKGHISGFLA